MLRDREEAADAAQQTFLSAHKALLAGTRPEEPEAWLATIARNECRQRIRRGMAAPPVAPLDDELDGRGDTAYDGAVRSLGVAELRAAVKELPVRQREALLLRDVRGLSYEDVAAAMGTTPPAVETLLVRARRAVVQRVRVVPDVASAWARELFGRVGGPADAATAAAVAAKGVAAVLAAVTATGAAVEVEQRAAGRDPNPAVIARVDDSAGETRGRHRGRDRGRDDEAAADRGSHRGSGPSHHSSGDDADTAAAPSSGRGSSGSGRSASSGSGSSGSGSSGSASSGSGSSGSGSSGSGRESGDDRSGSSSGSGSRVDDD